jgi:hypothetical protein
MHGETNITKRDVKCLLCVMNYILNIFTSISCFRQLSTLTALAETVLTVKLRRGKMRSCGSPVTADCRPAESNTVYFLCVN